MPDTSPTLSARTEAVGPFALSPSPLQLLFHGRALALDTAALQLLAVLWAQPGTIVTADVLWKKLQTVAPQIKATPDPTTQLLAHAASINTVMAECVPQGFYVAHYPGEGFAFVAPAPTEGQTKGQTPSQPPLALLAKPRDQRLQHSAGRASHIIGREAVIARLARQLPQQRFVTIVGAGGMGKTTVARALATQMAPAYHDGVYIVDLAPLGDARLVPTAVASALGLALSAQNTLGGLAAFVRDKQMLIVLDSCEHVVDSAAAVAEAVLQATGSVHVLATSREPLLARGEWLHRLSPMGLPAAGEAAQSTTDAMASPAVQLFVERATAANTGNAGYVFRESDIGPIAALCRRLDGIPLAIEIAAARVAQLGVIGLTSQVEGRLLSLTGTRRTAPPRHKTLAAMLDWSHDLLAAPEKRVLRRLSAFRGNFTLDAATAVAADAQSHTVEITDAVLSLVDKSLVAHASNGSLRLLDTTRAYAREKLGADAEYMALCRRHAEYLRHLLGIAQAEWEAMPRADWLARYGPWIDDIRKALEWSFSSDGDEPLGIALIFASFSLARQLSLDAEFKDHVQRALNALLHATPRQYLVEITLKAYIGSMGQRVESQDSPLYRSLEQILDLPDAGIGPRDQIIALGSLNHASLMAAHFSEAMVSAGRAHKAAHQSGDPVAIMIAERMQAQAQHFMGQHASAQTLAQNVLENSWRKIPLAYNPSPVDQRVSMRILQARILWMQGLADQADLIVKDCLLHAQSDTAIAQCQALAMCALPIALWNGRDAQCQALVSSLDELAARHSLAYWQHWARCYQQVLALRLADFPQPADASSATPPVAQALLQHGAFEANLRDHLCTFSPRLFGPDNVVRVRSAMVGWCGPEVLRLQGEAVRTQAPAEPARAEEFFHQALAMAGEQRALSWQLRSAISLARLLQSQGRASEARDQLADVCERFTEGLANADVRDAQKLLAELRAPRVNSPTRLRLI